MPSFNRVTLIGNLTRDPETKQLPGHLDSNLTVTEFGLAVNRRYRTSGGEDREETLFIDCTAFGKSADTLGQYAKKGRLLLVEGRLKFEAWEDRQGGKRSKISVVVENFQFLGTRESEGGEGGERVDPLIGVRAAPAPRRIGSDQQTLAESYGASQGRAAAARAESNPGSGSNAAVATAAPATTAGGTLTADAPAPPRRGLSARKQRGPNIPDVPEDSIPF